MLLNYQKVEPEEIIEFYKRKNIKAKVYDDVIIYLGRNGFNCGKFKNYRRCCFSNHILHLKEK